MKCEEIDFIEYVEGGASEEAKAHVEACRKCRGESARFSKFVNVVLPLWSEGKRAEAELEKELQSMDLAGMKRLPDEIAGKVTELKEKDVVERLKKIVKKGKGDTREFIETILTPRLHGAPASPRDMTKTTKRSRKKNPADKKEPGNG